MFVDEARIFVKAGDGGNGVVSFRREDRAAMQRLNVDATAALAALLAVADNDCRSEPLLFPVHGGDELAGQRLRRVGGGEQNEIVDRRRDSVPDPLGAHARRNLSGRRGATVVLG